MMLQNLLLDEELSQSPSHETPFKLSRGERFAIAIAKERAKRAEQAGLPAAAAYHREVAEKIARRS